MADLQRPFKDKRVLLSIGLVSLSLVAIALYIVAGFLLSHKRSWQSVERITRIRVNVVYLLSR
jgi:hypothetical protein